MPLFFYFIKKKFGQKNKIDFIFLMSYLQAPPSPPQKFGQKNKIDFIFSCLIYNPLPPLPIQCWREECWREGVYCIFNQH